MVNEENKKLGTKILINQVQLVIDCLKNRQSQKLSRLKANNLKTNTRKQH